MSFSEGDGISSRYWRYSDDEEDSDESGDSIHSDYSSGPYAHGSDGYGPWRHFTVAEKSSVKHGRLAEILKSTARPKGSLPPFALDAWRELTPDVKLPDIRDRTLGKIYYTRGRIGQKLARNKVDFDITDPYNRRAVPNSKEYIALHDPHCKGYFKQPSVMKHLKEQQLINQQGEVLCNVHEFNHYRSYLNTMFNTQVRRRISDHEAMVQMEASLKKSIYLHSQRTEGQQRHLINVRGRQTGRQKLLHTMYMEATRLRNATKVKGWQKRVADIEREKARAQVARSGEYTMKHWNAYLTRKKAEKLAHQRKKQTLNKIAYKEIKNVYVTKYDKFVKLALLERYKADQAAVMIARDDQIADMHGLVEETVKRSKKNWLKTYNGYIQKVREHRVKQHHAHRETEKRSHYLMRKYFRLWRRTTENNRENFDSEHQTLFGIRRRHLRPLVVDMIRHMSPEDRKKAEIVTDGRGRPKSIAGIATKHIESFPNFASRDRRGSVFKQLRKSLHQGDGDEADPDIEKATDELIDKALALGLSVVTEKDSEVQAEASKSEVDGGGDVDKGAVPQSPPKTSPTASEISTVGVGMPNELDEKSKEPRMSINSQASSTARVSFASTSTVRNSK